MTIFLPPVSLPPLHRKTLSFFEMVVTWPSSNNVAEFAISTLFSSREAKTSPLLPVCNV